MNGRKTGTKKKQKVPIMNTSSQMEGFVSFFGPDSDEDEPGTSLPTPMAAADLDTVSLPPEAFGGNIEYKLKLIRPCMDKLQHLVSQMKWRLEEGGGRALYRIGVEDNGLVTGLSYEDLDASLDTLRAMAETLGVELNIVNVRKVYCGCNRYAADAIVHHRYCKGSSGADLRIAVVGAADAGKSTIIGTLSGGNLDDGCGKSRLSLFRHLHEVTSGRTSSITEQVIGYNKVDDETINFQSCQTPMELLYRSTNLISFIDLAGHRKYKKTALFGLTSRCPHYAMLVVSTTSGTVNTTHEHAEYAVALGIPVFMVVTKSDLSSYTSASDMDESLDDMAESIIKQQQQREDSTEECSGQQGKLVSIMTEDEALGCCTDFHDQKITPVFRVSCVSGEGLPVLSRFISALSCVEPSVSRSFPTESAVEFRINQVISYRGHTLIVHGLLFSGTLKIGSSLNFGPLTFGNFKKVDLVSIRRQNVPYETVDQNVAVSVGLKLPPCGVIRVIRGKGMVLLGDDRKLLENVCIEFTANLTFLRSRESLQSGGKRRVKRARLSEGHRVLVHMSNICQAATVRHFQQAIEHRDSAANLGKKMPGEDKNRRVLVTLRFLRHHEFIRPGCRCVIRDGLLRAVGQVMSVE